MTPPYTPKKKYICKCATDVNYNETKLYILCVTTNTRPIGRSTGCAGCAKAHPNIKRKNFNNNN